MIHEQMAAQVCGRRNCVVDKTLSVVTLTGGGETSCSLESAEESGW
jgi:hypothetical protein